MDGIDALLVLQEQQYQIFKSQNFESGCFDITFEIEGKKLFAGKFTLTTVSDPFKIMLSEKWTKRDEPIELQSHSYDNFFNFLTFLYSGKCCLSSRNFSAMVDLAEFYDISVLKKLCDERLSRTSSLQTENVFHFIEVAKRYSLSASLLTLKTYVLQNLSILTQSQLFVKSSKAVIDLFVTCDRNRRQEEIFFEAVFKWAEFQVKQRQNSDESEKCDSNEAIKSELADILPNINFIQMSHEFLIQFVVKKSFLFSDDELSVILMQNYNETTAGYFSPKKGIQLIRKKKN